MASRKKPIVLLIRRVVDGRGVWIRHSDHASLEAADQCYESSICGRGVTAWSWWGPRRIADKMLLDPDYDADSEAIPMDDAVIGAPTSE